MDFEMASSSRDAISSSARTARSQLSGEGSFWNALEEVVSSAPPSTSSPGHPNDKEQLFAASFASLCGFGVVTYCLNFFPINFIGTTALYLLLLIGTWTRLHGGYLTRRRPFLETPVIPSASADTDTSPGGSRSAENARKKLGQSPSIIEFLFADGSELKKERDKAKAQAAEQNKNKSKSQEKQQKDEKGPAGRIASSSLSSGRKNSRSG